MKIWWVCVWDNYYPRGELRNVYSTHYTEAEANAVAAKLLTFDYDNAEWHELEDEVKLYCKPANVKVVNVSNLLGL